MEAAGASLPGFDSSATLILNKLFLCVSHFPLLERQEKHPSSSDRDNNRVAQWPELLPYWRWQLLALSLEMGKGLSVLWFSFFCFSKFVETRSHSPDQSLMNMLLRTALNSWSSCSSFSSAGLVSLSSGLGIDPRALHMPDNCFTKLHHQPPFYLFWHGLAKLPRLALN